MKVKCFTLTEMMVAMILSGILTSFVYWAYLNIRDYYFRIQQSQEKAIRFVEIRSQLDTDINTAEDILNTHDGFICNLPNGKGILYLGAPSFLIRKQDEMTDTLFSLCSLGKRNLALDTIETGYLDMIFIVLQPACDTIVLVKHYQKTDQAKIFRSLE